MIRRQQEPLHHVGNITERQRVISLADNQPLAVFHLLCHAPKVQAITRAKERTWPQDHRFDIAIEHQPPHQAIALRLRDTVRVWIGSQRIFLGHKTPISQAINGMGAGVDEATHTRRLGSSIQIFRAVHIDQAIIRQWTPYTHHSGQVKYQINIFDGRAQGTRIRHIPPHYLHALRQ